MKQPPLRDARGGIVTLSAELGRGGEGAVFEVVGRSDAVAKVYHKQPSSDHADKIAAMVAMRNADLLKISAWPTETLHSDRGGFVGFIMPKVGGHRPIFQLYSPKQRLREFPKADWRFLIHAAANAARAFGGVHSKGLVIGDVNHGNLVVAEDATVRMIDCDSFQVASSQKVWFCDVGVGTHQPPEMQGMSSYAGIKRTDNHDNFGLAIVIFQLLCIARHPFAGRFTGRGEPPSIEDAIRASRYAYSRDSVRTQLEPPHGSLPIDALTPEIRDLFERAFSASSTIGGRPTAAKWIGALDRLASDLKACRSNPAHYFRKDLTGCPWCSIETNTGVTLFPVVFIPGSSGLSGIAALWQEVTSIKQPENLGPPPTTPSIKVGPSAAALEMAKKEKLKAVIAVGASFLAVIMLAFAAPYGLRFFLVILGAISWWYIRKNSKKILSEPFASNLVKGNGEWAEFVKVWDKPPNAQMFIEIRSKINQLKGQYDGLPNDRAKRLQTLHEQRRNNQLAEHLDRYSLSIAKIPGIGPAKVATLASYGVDTAGDIDAMKIDAIPGFGPVAITKLVDWRRQKEASFRFDPNRGVSSSATTAVERDIAALQQRLSRELLAHASQLKSVASAINAKNAHIKSIMPQIEARYAQALADANYIPQSGVEYRRLTIIAVVIAAISFFGSLHNNSSIPAPVPKPVSPPMATQQPTAQQGLSIAGQLPALPQASTPDRRASNPVVSSPYAPAVAAPAVIGRVRIKQEANVRANSVNTSPVVRTVSEGTILNVFARNNGWVQVGNFEIWGWIFSGLSETLP